MLVLRSWYDRNFDVNSNRKPPFPPFDEQTAVQKVRMAEDAWNTRDPNKVALAYTEASRWRNRAEFVVGRDQIKAFLQRKWSRELEYRLIKELWAFQGNRIAVRFAYEWRDDSGQWYRSYGNENWQFDDDGFMERRIASINDLPIPESDRKFHWPQVPSDRKITSSTMATASISVVYTSSMESSM